MKEKKEFNEKKGRKQVIKPSWVKHLLQKRSYKQVIPESQLGNNLNIFKDY